MKKFFMLLLLLFAYKGLFAQTYAIGISVGEDFYNISDLSKGFNLQDLTEAKLSRTGFENPLAFGLNFAYNPPKKYSLLFETDFNYLEYDIKYTRNVPELLDPLKIKTTNYKVPWARLGTMVSLNYIFYQIDRFDFIFGGGLGLQVFAPAVSDKFIYETLLNKLSELNISDDIDLNYSFSQKINLGITYNLYNSNFNISIFTNYIFVNNAVYKAPDNFLALKFQVNYLFY